MQETPVLFLGWEDPGIGYPFQYSWAFLVAQTVKEFTCNVEDLGSIPGLGRSPGGGHDNPPQCSHLENPDGQRSLVGYSPWGHRVGYDWVTKYSTAQFRTHILTVLRKNLGILGMGYITGTRNLCWKIKLSPKCSHLHFFSQTTGKGYSLSYSGIGNVTNLHFYFQLTEWKTERTAGCHTNKYLNVQQKIRPLRFSFLIHNPFLSINNKHVV